MAEYIDRKVLENVMAMMAANETEKDRHVWARAISLLHDVPTVDVVPVVHGHWIKKEKYSNDSDVVCSECKMEFDYIDGVCYLVSGSELPHYCPNCGTKMDLED